MPDERAERLAELVKAAVEYGPEGWPAFLDEECGADTAMRAKVEALLRHHERAAQFIEKPALRLAVETLMCEAALETGAAIADYEIISLVGSGGMGDVYLAHDRRLQRQVALKIVRRGLDGGDLTRRFRREEQILAGLNHPNIARLYDGAVTKDGVPYLVMEYVDGKRLDDYCLENRLSIRRRLVLFQKVCGAVAYAHQHLVIHRDIKPGNIRVTAEGEPKLLDFGIAKLLHPEMSLLGEQTMTFPGAMTPEYASPEQVRGEAIATTSDVYSLGVVLYKLVTGQGPYRTRTSRPDEIARAITEEEPERPSMAVARSVADHQSLTNNPERALRGDLDNIILKALRKEPERRYQSVGQFSADIQRHLDGLPVIARKDTWSYRSAKFITRHRVGVTAAGLILLTLFGGMITTLWQARTARRAQAKAEAIKNFLEQTLDSSNPGVTGKNDKETTVADFLDQAARRLEEGEFSNDVDIRTELEQVIARNYWGQGKYQQAQKYLPEAVSRLGKLYGEHHPLTLVASSQLAQSLFFRNELTEAENTYRRILPLMREQKKKGNISAANLASALSGFACVKRTEGDSKEAEGLFREALSLSSQLSASEWKMINATTRSTLASTLADQGRFEEALQTAHEAVAELRQRGEAEKLDFGFSLTILGGLLTEKGDLAAADASLREAEAIFRRLYQSANLWTADNGRNQAELSYRQGNFTAALDKATETLNVYRTCFGTHYDNYPTALIIRGLSLTKLGQPDEGEKILREAVKIRTESLPRDHYWVALANSALGECLTIEKRHQEAEPLLRDSYESLRRSQGGNNPRTRLALQRLVALYESWGRSETANAYRAKLAADKF